MNNVTISKARRIGSLIRQSLRGEEMDYTKGSLRRAVLLLAVPMMLEMAMESVFAVVDLYFVGHLEHSRQAIQTVGLTESVLTIIYSLAIGMSMAATAVVARRVGEKNPEAAANLDSAKAHAKEAVDATKAHLKEAFDSSKAHLKEAVDHSKENLKHAADDLRAAAEAKARELREAAAAKTAEFRERAGQTYGETRERVRTIQEDGEAYIRQNPTKAVLTAVAAGFLLGLMFRR